MAEPLLTIRGLRAGFAAGRTVVPAVRGVDLDVGAGEKVALVGESGSGKSVTARTVLGLNDPAARIEGTVEVGGRDVLRMTERELRAHRGRRVGLVFQDPQSSLDPLMRIGAQVEEAVTAHGYDGDARARAVELLRLVGIPDPARRLADHPHHWSGGMRQRVMIAVALAGGADLLVADEPTTALDVTVQAQVLDLFATVNRELGTAILLVTHNLGVVAGLCDRVHVMYAGRIVEHGPVREVFARPRHPYTRGLLGAVARLDADPDRPLVSIPGRPPAPDEVPDGCAFVSRCELATDRCRAERPPLVATAGRASACWHAGEVPAATVADRLVRKRSAAGAEPVLAVRGLRKSYATRPPLVAVDGVDLTVHRGEAVGLVGESGCGKSTLAKLVLRIVDATAGAVEVLGRDVTALRGAALRPLRAQVQLVFQDPYASLNPRHTVGTTLAEPLRVHGIDGRRDRAVITARVGELLATVGLDGTISDRRPRELSGGQRQRVALARALAPSPDLLVLDEPVSALDVSMQAQIVNLLRDVTDRLGLASLFIAHDIAMVRHLSDRIAVMYLGRIVEEGPAVDVCATPAHPYTAGLLAAVPSVEPPAGRVGGAPAVVPLGEPPSPADPPSGCAYHPRCPVGPLAYPDRTVCATTPPPLTEIAPGRKAACHFAGESR